jgi:hypothetical protein
MTSTPDTGPDDAVARDCKRPGCGNAIPPGAGRGRHRVFCGDDCDGYLELSRQAGP